ncbi:MAG: hypothetical protein JEY97_10295 [Bacteroidales bacterium]|nr:hypothetical protein [Bacteroidales bacterium]
MEIFELDKIVLFIIFFIPGFISMKVYHLMIASEKINFSESLGEAIAFSSINYAALSWLIILIDKYDLVNNNFALYILLVIFIIFIAPIIWTIIFVWLSKSKKLRKYILSPIKNPWDYYFEKNKSCWVIVNLKNGERIGGVYSSKSFSSAFPNKEQIYLEQLWEIDTKGNFLRKIDRSDGIIIIDDEIKSVEFYK